VRPPVQWGSEERPQAKMMVETARRFDVSDDATLVLRMDYLEAVIGKPATP
jgi:hypothetical protein